MSPRAVRLMEVLHFPVPESVADPPVAIEAVTPVARPGARRVVAIALDLTVAAVLLALAALVVDELTASRIQSRILSGIAADATWEDGPGASTAIVFPVTGPYDQRLGYARLPAFLKRLRQEGAAINSQARWPEGAVAAVQAGLFPTYREKDRAGLRVRDRDGRLLYQSTWPRRTWTTFSQIPPILVDVLRFIENRDLLDPGLPYRNPAVEWDRLMHAMAGAALVHLGLGDRVFGGSTLATQVEKFRHSEDGRTRTPRDKLRQMESAALRAYREGPVTLEAQRRIALSYLDTLPLGAVPGYGEVLGLPDGLWAWFGTDFDLANRLLRRAPRVRLDRPEDAPVAAVFRESLALLLAQRRPAWFRGDGRESLERLTDSYLRVLAREGVISRGLRDLALRQRLAFADSAPPDPPEVVGDRKGVDAVRTSLLGLLGIDSLHDLDRLDLNVRATLDAGLQGAVGGMLRSLGSVDTVKRLGMRQANLLGAGDPADVVYSFVLYERDGDAAVLRAQTDEFDGPFSLNDQMKLELGSTAKLRTLVSYLEVVAEIQDRLDRAGRAEVARARNAVRDPLTRFVAAWRTAHPAGTLPELLRAALDRTYSASPRERFRTGGGLHSFANFRAADDGKAPTVREAFHQSINLVFVRLMRDVVATLIETGPTPGSQVLSDAADPRRIALLQRFADQEGQVFQEEAWRKIRGLAPNQVERRVLDDVPREARRIAAAYRTLRPEAGEGDLAEVLRARLPDRQPDRKRVADLFVRSAAPTLANLQDQGFVAGVHPLTLATAAWRMRHPDGGFEAMVRDTAAARQEAYRWLFRSTRKSAQDQRIGDTIEREAFQRLHERWARVGYPFPTLVPSLATAIGSSGDQPRALAELAGIVQAGGIRAPLVRVDRLRFGAGTPYDTEVGRPGGGGIRVMRPEVAEAVRAEMVEVVDHGTARRVRGAFLSPDGPSFVVGGKTGTGDNRIETYGPRGEVLSSVVRNRTGTFVFFVGQRWFGAVTAHVPGQAAARYRFTSALPVEVLRLLAPSILASAEAPE